MKDFQQRVVNEKAELDVKAQKLSAFIGGSVYETLDGQEQERLKQQLTHMTRYSDVLRQRIAAMVA